MRDIKTLQEDREIRDKNRRHKIIQEDEIKFSRRIYKGEEYEDDEKPEF